MNSRERVLAALTRSGVPDRVPLQFDLCRKLTDAFAEKHNIPATYTTSYFEDVTYRISANELRLAMGSDVVVVGGSLPSGYSHPVPKPGHIINEFGMLMEQGPLYMQTVEAPLAHANSVKDVENHPFPDPYAEGRFDDAQYYTDKYKKDYVIVGDLELTMFEMSWHHVGLEKFLVDMATKEDYVSALLDKVMAFSLGIARRLAEVGVDAIWFGVDFGSQNNMMISPRMWRNIFKPRFAELWQEVKAINPNIIIAHHTDGAVSPILDDLADIGLQVFNPVQPNVPGHNPQELKDKVGKRLAFWGAIDQQYLLPQGTTAEIEADVAEKIRILGKGGGYLCSPAHIVQSDVPMENLEAFIAAVQKHGVY